MKTRTIAVKFMTEEALKEFSLKLYPDGSKSLLPHTNTCLVANGDIKQTYKRFSNKNSNKDELWKTHWKDLTKFELPPLDGFSNTVFNFGHEYDNKKLSELFDQTVTEKTKSIFYPKKEVSDQNRKRIIGDRGNPQYPIYIITKGRSENCSTADHLIKMGVPFRLIVEKQEIDLYAKYYGYENIVELDMSFRDAYDTYIPDFDVTKSKGSGPARNFVWWHSKNVLKAKWHWIMDDNIYGFSYFYDNQRIKAVDGTLFAAAEDFVNRYDNIGISGLNYFSFAIPGSKDRPYVDNTKIYSCLLINNDTNIRWAGRYNEDVDLCIRALKEGYSTIQFDAYLAKKGATQTIGGGNTDAFYADEGTLPKSNMLAWNHPDITNVIWRFARWHHITNYDVFDYYKNRTIKEVIEELSRKPILDATIDSKIIDDINSIDFSTIKKWKILQYVPEQKRNEILTVLKFFRYTKDNKRLIDILTRPRILDCDLTDHLWHREVPDTEDNRIMKDLLSLADNDGKLFYSVNFDEILSYVNKEKRDIIAKEMVRNKYLQKPYEKYTYNLREYLLTEEEHLGHHDSKAYILEHYEKKPGQVIPKTLFDEKVRKEVKIEQTKFTSQLVTRGKEIVKDNDNYTLFVHGDDVFNDEDLLEKELNNLIKTKNIQEIVNCVDWNIDLLSANYALENKILNKMFVPDHILNGKLSYNVIYDKIVEYANECVLFLSKEPSESLEYLTSLFKKHNKDVTIIKNISNTEVIDEW